MSSAETFLEAILNDPDNDALRLVYADWLEERGDPRGEFIRVQFELAATREPAQQSRLAAREQELLARHGEEWGRPFREMGASPVYRRGFVEGLRVDAETFLKHGESFFKVAPMRRIQFRDAREAVPRLVQSPLLARLSALDFHANSLHDVEIHHLAECHHLKGLKELVISNFHVSQHGARALAASPHFGNLVHLDLSNGHIGDLGLQALCASQTLPRLRSLEVAACGIEISGLRTLATSPFLSRLQRLDVGRNDLGNHGLRALVSSPRLSNVRSLCLSNALIDSLSIRALAASPHVKNLTELNLSANQISPGGVIALAESPHLSNLTDLYLMGNPIRSEEKEALRKRFRCTVHF